MIKREWTNIKQMVRMAIKDRDTALSFLGVDGESDLLNYWRSSSMMELLAYPVGIERLREDKVVSKIC